MKNLGFLQATAKPPTQAPAQGAGNTRGSQRAQQREAAYQRSIFRQASNEAQGARNKLELTRQNMPDKGSEDYERWQKEYEEAKAAYDAEMRQIGQDYNQAMGNGETRTQDEVKAEREQQRENLIRERNEAIAEARGELEQLRRERPDPNSPEYAEWKAKYEEAYGECKTKVDEINNHYDEMATRMEAEWRDQDVSMEGMNPSALQDNNIVTSDEDRKSELEGLKQERDNEVQEARRELEQLRMQRPDPHSGEYGQWQQEYREAQANFDAQMDDINSRYEQKAMQMESRWQMEQELSDYQNGNGGDVSGEYSAWADQATQLMQMRPADRNSEEYSSWQDAANQMAGLRPPKNEFETDEL